MIDKPTILITSLGRTGTQFFSQLFAHLLPAATALHEPDVWNVMQYPHMGERLRQIRRQLAESGLWNMTVGKASGHWGLAQVADARLRGHLAYASAAQELRRQRARFIATRPGPVYVEANVAFYGLIDVAASAFAHHRLIYLVRDGRDWVRSHMNWGELYGNRGWRGRWARQWPTAPELPGDPYADQWARMTRFERVCWAWSRLNAYALQTVTANPHARVFHFEQIFRAADRDEHLADLVAFATDLPGARPATSFAGWLERPIHASAGSFPAWSGWTAPRQARFRQICGPLMAQLGYDMEARHG